MNTGSSFVLEGVLGVNYPIQDPVLTVSSVMYGEPVTGLLVMSNGSHITCARYYDDGTIEVNIDYNGKA